MSKDKKGYSKSLNLPKTSFSMKANLVQREPQMRKDWQKKDMYSIIRNARAGEPMYVLHDGPPYANGDIHMGHVINKVLKDIVLKYKTMAGFDAPYVPGWDCHGLPIEVKVVSELGDKAKEMSKPELRKLCKKYASKYVKLQAKQFEALGIFGDFKNPYLTLKPSYEKGILEIFAELVGNALVYKQLKPIHWCPDCQTALADAELEYKDIMSSSIFVNFAVTDETKATLKNMQVTNDTDTDVNFMIWTTTPWTLTANLAVAVHPRLDYQAVTYEKNGRKITSIVCSDRVEDVMQAASVEQGNYTLGKTVKGSELAGLRYDHPFTKNPTDKDAYMVVLAEYVTTEDGTGLVHTAPGHGVDDYMCGQNAGLGIYSPVNADGSYDDTVPDWLKGKNVLEVDPVVIEHLSKLGVLVTEKKISHSYPHCWRSKTPIIFRATEQWFVGVDKDIKDLNKNLRNLALEKIGGVKWVPAWGEKRIRGMLESRPDWCISRQRSWGLPIPVFTNAEGKTLLTKESVLRVAEYIGQKGSDCWFTDSPKEILGEDFPLPEDFNWEEMGKEENIFDVWFESGCSWHSVAEAAGWDVPVDLYLEGSDQHRGWFQLSLLPALGATGEPPFKTVLTHGFTVDEKGMKQSKSLGNYVSAMDEIQKYGADILRMWVASVNYQEDVRCSDELIGRTQEAYRKIRNTMRYLFGNLHGFDINKHAVAYEDMYAIDQWAIQNLCKLIEQVNDAYDNFTFHRVYGSLYNFCTVEMSSIYMDILKDRLYCEAADSKARQSCQTAMYYILDAFTKMIAPILAHTAEEAWHTIENKTQDVESVHLASIAKVVEAVDYKAEENKWQVIMQTRDAVLQKLETLRQEKIIASNQEASLTIKTSDAPLLKALNELGADQFAALCIVSQVSIEEKEGDTEISAEKCSYQKCQRCWNYLPSVGQNTANPDLCQRCSEVISTG